MPARPRYSELAPEGIAHMRALEHYLNASTALSAVLLELVRLRVSLKNGCEFCVGHHTHELRKHNEPPTRIDALRDWRNSDAFTPKERAAFAWADSVTEIQTCHAADEDYAAAATFFEVKDLVDLTLAIASINAWNRLSIAFRAEWDPEHHKERSALQGESPEITAQSLPETTPTPDDAPFQDTVEDDGGKVAHE